MVTTPDYEVNPKYQSDIITSTVPRSKVIGGQKMMGGSEVQNTANFDGSMMSAGNEEAASIAQQ